MIVWYNEITDNVLSTYVHCWVLVFSILFCMQESPKTWVCLRYCFLSLLVSISV